MSNSSTNITYVRSTSTVPQSVSTRPSTRESSESLDSEESMELNDSIGSPRERTASPSYHQNFFSEEELRKRQIILNSAENTDYLLITAIANNTNTARVKYSMKLKMAGKE